MDGQKEAQRRVVGGVDTHKDLHVAAVVDEQDRVLGTRCFATTRQGYRQMLAWMRSFGDLQRIGIEFDRQLRRGPAALHAAGRDRGPGGHDAGQAGSAPARQERRSRRAERRPCRLCRQANRHAAKPRRHDRIPAGSHGLPEDGGRARRRVALQMIHNTIVCAPDGLRDTLRSHDPHAARPNAGRLATGPDRLSRLWKPPIASASSRSPAATSNCMTRSPTSM